MDSAYKERVNCLGKLNNQGKGTLKRLSLEKERKKTEESVKHFKHMLGWKVEVEERERYDVSEAEKDISDTKKEAAEKLKKDLAEKIAILESAKKDLKTTVNKTKQYRKDIREGKKLIASHTKRLKKIKKGTDKCYERERKGETGKKTARCPNGTRKNKSSGKCEKK